MTQTLPPFVQPSPADPPSRAIRLLVADDDEINLAIIHQMIQAEGGFTLTIAQDGREALTQATSARFDALMFDLNMPFINGDRLIRHLRASQSINATSAMFLFTAAADSFGRLDNGALVKLADQILPKPIRAQTLFDAIRAKVRR